jgi:hypothetical protein
MEQIKNIVNSQNINIHMPNAEARRTCRPVVNSVELVDDARLSDWA